MSPAFRSKCMNALFDFSHTRFSFNRPLTDYSKIQALIGVLVRSNKIQLFRKSFQKNYLNCGCGSNIHPHFINLDYDWRPGIDLCWDATKGLPFPDGSLQGIYTEHMLEHIPLRHVPVLLNEFHRVLKKGGPIRVVVPDAELYLDLYQFAKQGKTVSFPYGEQDLGATPLMHVNRVFRGYEHQYAYDYETLRTLLDGAGFLKITKLSYNRGKDPNLLVDSKSREIESLYVEAIA